MQALMVIALMCQVHGGVLFLQRIDKYQMECQKKLIACYEAKFPKSPTSELEWIGGLKDCVKERKL